MSTETEKVTIERVVYETSGTAWYEEELDPATGLLHEDQDWPDLDNTDTDIVKVILSDGDILDLRRTFLTRDDEQVEANEARIAEIVGKPFDEWREEVDEQRYEYNYAPKPEPPQTILFTLRDPDASNEYHEFGPSIEVVDVDYGYADLHDKEEFEEWYGGHAGTVADLRKKGRNDAADFLQGVIDEARVNYGHAE